MRRFCRVPGEIFRSSRTSADLNHCLVGVSVVFEFLISLKSRLPKFSNSLLVTTWWFSSSMLSVSGNSTLWLKFIMLYFVVIWHKTIAFEKEKFPSWYQLGNDFYFFWVEFVVFSLNHYRFWFLKHFAIDLKIGFDLIFDFLYRCNFLWCCLLNRFGMLFQKY